jgi:hypothetical protein
MSNEHKERPDTPVPARALGSRTIGNDMRGDIVDCTIDCCPICFK